jgi:hypothetical protein
MVPPLAWRDISSHTGRITIRYVGQTMPIEILALEQLQKITGMKRYSALFSWFCENFHVSPVLRPDGSILMTQVVSEALLMKKMGLGTPSSTIDESARPKLRPAIPVRR